MYLKCPHGNRDITAEIDSAWSRQEALQTINRTETLAYIPDEELLRRAIGLCRANLGRSNLSHPRWVAVMELFQIGLTDAQKICRRFGFDPEEMVRR